MILDDLDYSLTPNVRISLVKGHESSSKKEKLFELEEKSLVRGRAIFIGIGSNFVTDEPYLSVAYKNNNGGLDSKSFKVSDLLGLKVTETGGCVGYKNDR